MKKINNTKLGLTSLELIVVLGIFATLLGITMFNYSDFSARINLENTVQEVALRLQAAQNHAISGLYPPLQQGGQGQPPYPGWKPAYGVYFSLTSPSSFAYFYDQNSENADTSPFDRDGLMYGNPASPSDPDTVLSGNFSCGLANTECLDIVQIATGEKIIAICNDDLANNDCGHEHVTVSFNRPFPEAKIIVDDVAGVIDQQNQPAERVTILILGKAQAGVRGVVVTRLGQIFNINVPSSTLGTISLSPTILSQANLNLELFGIYSNNGGNNNGNIQQNINPNQGQ